MNGTEAEQNALDEMIKDYLDAFNSGDYKRVASYWTEDAVSLPPIGGELRGRDALEDFYRNSFETMNPQISDYSHESRFVADHVIVRESWAVTMNLQDQDPISTKGWGLWIGIKERDGVLRTFWSLARIDQG